MGSQKVIVAGTGVSGIAAAKLLLALGGKVLLYDGNEKLSAKEIRAKFSKNQPVSVLLGELRRSDLADVELCIISPGIPLESKLVSMMDEAKIPVWGEIQLAYHCAKGRLAAITGTNGKTTTTALTGQIVKDYLGQAFVVGNIGIPYTEIALETEDDSVTVAEVSSFQLETIMNFHPQVSAILNITPDHLDRHRTMERYIEVKKCITVNQEPEDVLVLNYDDPVLREFGRKRDGQGPKDSGAEDGGVEDKEKAGDSKLDGANPGNAKPDKMESGKAEPDKGEANKPERDKGEANKLEPDRDERSKPEPDRDRAENTSTSLEETLKAAQKSEEVVEAAYPEIVVRAKVVFFSSRHVLEEGIYLDGESIIWSHDGKKEKVIRTDELLLLGRHNYENVMAAVAISLALGIPLHSIQKTLREFKAVEHRIEFVAEKGGVKYYNDSKGTNPDAAIQAIRAMPGPTVLIAGGYDKQSTYDEWIEAFEGKVKYLVLIGQTRDKIARCAREHGFHDIIYAEDMQEAVSVCASYANRGENVLLSPACASWGMFKNFEERGRIFKECVLGL